jgi:hypothetical protein
MTRVTNKDVERRVGTLASLIPHALHGRRVVYEAGSPTYGRAHRLFTQALDSDGKPTGGLYNYFDLDNGYLGWSAREAMSTVNGLIAGIRFQQQGGK